MSETDFNAVDELRARVADSSATESDVVALQELLSDQQNLEYYCGLAVLESHLRYEGASPGELAGLILPSQSESHSSAYSIKRSRFRLVTAGSVALAAVVCIVMALVWTMPPGGQTASPLATVTAAEHCRSVAGRSVHLGDEFGTERIDLAEGLLGLTLAGGVELLLEAPVQLRLESAQRCVLLDGYVVAKVPEQAIGFEITTPDATVVDLGTEFGVAIDSDRRTVVQVFDGDVETHFNREEHQPKQYFQAGDAAVLSDNGSTEVERIKFDPNRFVRRFPLPESREGDELSPYNTSKLKSVTVAKIETPLQIDADLSDWPSDSTFSAQCDPPYAKTYRVVGRLGYDENFLYVAADVSDPFPLRSVITPDGDPNVVWRGGSVQLRISCDRAIGWPVDAHIRRHDVPLNPSEPRTRLGYRPQDVNPKLAHLTMWHHQPAGKSCLQIAYGMDFTNVNSHPAGWRGRFRQKEQGRGYLMEYAIPWELLNAGDDPPQAADVLAANWTVHWSDEGGRIWRGHLVEVTNPDEPGLTFHRAATWGQAIFE
ncbi:FecR domain-containing protein [Stratiformator vulcanicus]|uniref:FecR domain-containing protein n=1 Tax=Stratiformator vulcanicus TaxID=2527980 RepID=UPI002877BB48|nr:FecR domain-containing protein [Stratiformator vulcanicus]